MARTTTAYPDAAGRTGSEPAQLLGQRAEPQRAEVEDGAVPGLEVEAGAVPGPSVLAAGEEHPLADLVHRRLARPAEVAVQLVGAHRVVHGAVLAEEVRGRLVAPARTDAGG